MIVCKICNKDGVKAKGSSLCVDCFKAKERKRRLRRNEPDHDAIPEIVKKFSRMRLI